MEGQEVQEKKEKKGVGALFIPAGLFVGMGVGFLVSNLVAWMFVGLGAGFFLFAVSYLMGK